MLAATYFTSTGENNAKAFRGVEEDAPLYLTRNAENKSRSRNKTTTSQRAQLQHALHLGFWWHGMEWSRVVWYGMEWNSMAWDWTGDLGGPKRTPQILYLLGFYGFVKHFITLHGNDVCARMAQVGLFIMVTSKTSWNRRHGDKLNNAQLLCLSISKMSPHSRDKDKYEINEDCVSALEAPL